ncbi:MAG: phage major capsid protein [Candidatus Omnitrophica bacterium]|nr:phage major capsid protein [Candidatus Omnitrophota bacterium]
MDISTASKYQTIAKYIKTGEGRSRIAASFTQPLRQRRDYQSVGRRAFYVEQLLDGQLPIWDKDANVTAFVIGAEGQNIQCVQKPPRVFFDLFEIASNPEISITKIREKRFDVLERSLDLARSAIMAQEDRYVFATMDALAASATNPNPVIQVTGNLTSNVLIDAKAAVERNDIRVANIFMNAKDYNDLLKFDRDTLSPEYQTQLLKNGLMANIWGINIIVSRIVAEGDVYVCGEPEFFGRIPVRQDLTVLSADDPRNRMVGFSVFEMIGCGLWNPLAMSKIQITRV